MALFHKRLFRRSWDLRWLRRCWVRRLRGCLPDMMTGLARMLRLRRPELRSRLQRPVPDLPGLERLGTWRCLHWISMVMIKWCRGWGSRWYRRMG
jgi:hypothetical protein